MEGVCLWGGKLRALEIGKSEMSEGVWRCGGGESFFQWPRDKMKTIERGLCSHLAFLQREVLEEIRVKRRGKGLWRESRDE
ncbi:hypothetical protein COLO4_21583 [Corchorus olitorius]|uniref:Uncharacterized protein n=1 Tax=Corchorus olitorius TaxID=93759 RepID=A0A1R3ISH0_9ROSI|nr:hypothetical protein COLO4_21583 [Corchorus olitorius]